MATKYINYFKRYSGGLGVVVLWASVTISMSRSGLGVIDTRPISYLGVDPMTAGIFSSGLIISALLFITFGFYVRYHFKVNNKFLFYLIIGQIGQIIAAIAPYGMVSRYKRIHTIAAFILAFSLPMLIAAFAKSQAQSPYKQTYNQLLRLEQIAFVLGISLFVFTKGIAPLGEALPAIGYHIWIITVTLISIKDQKQIERSV